MMKGEEGGMQVLESRFDLNDERVWFGKAKLLPDRIVLKGLGYHRRIDLEDIVEVRWAADELVIGLRNGDEIDMTIKAAALWKYELQARCGLTEAATGDIIAGMTTKETVSSVPERDEGAQSPDAIVGEEEAIGNPTRKSKPGVEDGDETVDDDTSGDEWSGAGEQTEMFLQRESTYRIRNGFAEDRPQQPKRAEDHSSD